MGIKTYMYKFGSNPIVSQVIILKVNDFLLSYTELAHRKLSFRNNLGPNQEDSY